MGLRRSRIKLWWHYYLLNRYLWSYIIRMIFWKPIKPTFNPNKTQTYGFLPNPVNVSRRNEKKNINSSPMYNPGINKISVCKTSKYENASSEKQRLSLNVNNTYTYIFTLYSIFTHTHHIHFRTYLKYWKCIEYKRTRKTQEIFVFLKYCHSTLYLPQTSPTQYKLWLHFLLYRGYVYSSSCLKRLFWFIYNPLYHLKLKVPKYVMVRCDLLKDFINVLFCFQ